MIDNGGTLDVARALALARAIRALVDGGATSLARQLVAALVGLLERAQAEGAPVVSLDEERAKRGRS